MTIDNNKDPINRRTFLRNMMWLGTGVISGFSLIEGRREIDKTEITYHNIKTEKLKKNIKIVHLTDLHLDEGSRRLNTIELINNQEPDLILMTGDYTNSNYYHQVNQSIVKDYMNSLRSIYGIYSTFGNWDIGYERRMFNGTEVKTIRDSHVEIALGEDRINLVGLDYFKEDNYTKFKTDKIFKQINSDTYNIFMYHTPDLIEDISQSGKIDLYLAGHTHGGQIRVPFLRYLTNGAGDLNSEFPYSGAIVTLSKFGTKYQSGIFTVGQTKLFVGRGIGVGLHITIRIFCRPEIGVFTIGHDVV
ncbi:MAG: metallophosphoesterase [Nitrospirae bacterium]|nr:metallophosphoesterase [Nitrospirota bacterium]MBF0541438.1 metallophosphoesterase [Nitrospirota bacterium]